jgi:hypothetical protein
MYILACRGKRGKPSSPTPQSFSFSFSFSFSKAVLFPSTSTRKLWRARLPTNRPDNPSGPAPSRVEPKRLENTAPAGQLPTHPTHPVNFSLFEHEHYAPQGWGKEEADLKEKEKSEAHYAINAR